jgi:hypothetical protein
VAAAVQVRLRRTGSRAADRLRGGSDALERCLWGCCGRLTTTPPARCAARAPGAQVHAPTLSQHETRRVARTGAGSLATSFQGAPTDPPTFDGRGALRVLQEVTADFGQPHPSESASATTSSGRAPETTPSECGNSLSIVVRFARASRRMEPFTTGPPSSVAPWRSRRLDLVHP